MSRAGGTPDGLRSNPCSVPASPSAWSRRLPVVVLALIGCAIATYLTLYQWRVTTSVWDPFFGSHSSEAVLSSPISRFLPLPDATLGALAYLIEAIVTALGGRNRWRTSPWLVV
ncbi:MAG: vitamin K epoxide reductase, partial [Chloroflexi bacterium]|nr:vitamin K epoxide reductase [Chloroflexota bacterium]